MQLDEVKQSLVCGFCGSVQVLEPDSDGVALLGTTSPFQCPVCSTPLEEAAARSRKLLCCPRCRGLLIGMDEFIGLIGVLRADHAFPTEPLHRFNPDDLRRVIACPRCRRRMDAHAYAGPGNVVIDSCEACHVIWLDHNEVMRIASAPDHTRAEDDELPQAGDPGF
jgi:Zn-finger nucleic acid-binding protein